MVVEAAVDSTLCELHLEGPMTSYCLEVERVGGRRPAWRATLTEGSGSQCPLLRMVRVERSWGLP
jgi:hypothetical protein